MCEWWWLNHLAKICIYWMKLFLALPNGKELLLVDTVCFTEVGGVWPRLWTAFVSLDWVMFALLMKDPLVFISQLVPTPKMEINDLTYWFTLTIANGGWSNGFINKIINLPQVSVYSMGCRRHACGKRRIYRQVLNAYLNIYLNNCSLGDLLQMILEILF